MSGFPKGGWIYNPVPPHECIVPLQREVDKRFEGALWRCGECQKVWTVAFNGREKEFRLVDNMNDPRLSLEAKRILSEDSVRITSVVQVAPVVRAHVS